MLVQSGPVYFSGKRNTSGPEQNIRQVGEALASLQEARTPAESRQAGKKLARNWIGAGLKLMGQGLWDMATSFFKR